MRAARDKLCGTGGAQPHFLSSLAARTRKPCPAVSPSRPRSVSAPYPFRLPSRLRSRPVGHT
ncbi:hypothetical protein CU044_4822 [Streptomyces sp. L-9-10]|nr:hypothetical protein CU044_4822 [Streptomyces sp. L-9-10]